MHVFIQQSRIVAEADLSLHTNSGGESGEDDATSEGSVQLVLAAPMQLVLAAPMQLVLAAPMQLVLAAPNFDSMQIEVKLKIANLYTVYLKVMDNKF